MAASGVHIIDTSGQPGSPGVGFGVASLLDRFNSSASRGQDGKNGRSARHASAGAPGTDISVRLACSYETPTTVQLFDCSTTTRWEITRGETMLLKADGGNGGDGGRGEDGENGGPGEKGRDATAFNSSKSGGPGGRGGDGGYGSNGANGGEAGKITVNVDHDDTDLLLPLSFSVKGGSGGKRGAHGAPGEGGRGGRGGHSYYDPGSGMHRSGGCRGSDGCSGYRPTTQLSAGSRGANGSVQIDVSNRGRVKTYRGAYKLEVLRFDITDENNDGINEPGEHILVRNLVVRNVGLMPSPATQPVNVLIEGTRYLEPVLSESVQLPLRIRPGQVVEVPGVLRALIRKSAGAAPVGSIANIDVWVQLVGTFERLDRPIPDFCDPRRIKISYPLVLDRPISLGSVAKGDVVTFRWLLRNMSRKPYGYQTERPCGTTFSETQIGQEACFMLTDESQGSNQIDQIQPGSSLTIEQEFIVNGEAQDFTYVDLELKLRLSDPQTKAMHTAQEHRMQVQVSSHYQQTDNAGYLLVVNSGTPNYAIRQTLGYLKHGLLANVDVFNVSIYGSYDVPGSSESVLSKYMGKSIIIFGNNYDHPGVGFKRPWDFMDPWVATVLLRGGTSLHFPNVSDLAALSSLKAWAELVVFPAHRLTANRQAFEIKDDKALATNLRNEKLRLVQEPIQEKGDLEAIMEVLHDFPVTQSKLNLFGSLDATLSRRVQAAVNLLDKSVPLRRFAVAPAPIASPRVLVVEGVPRTAKFTATTSQFRMMPLSGSIESVSIHDAFLLVGSLPYTVRVRMFWNAVQHGDEDGKGIRDDALFAGIKGFASSSPEKASPNRPTAFNIHPQVLQALTLFLQFDLCNEIYLMTGDRSRFSDLVPTKEKLSQMTLTCYFFDSAPPDKDGVQQIQNAKEAQSLISVLGTVHAVSNSLSSWHCLRATFASMGNQQGQLKSQINDFIFGVIQRTCAPSIADDVKEQLMARSEEVKLGILSQPRWMPQSYNRVGNQELIAFTNNANGGGAGRDGCGYIDLVDSPRTGLALSSQAWKEWVDGYEASGNARTGSVEVSRRYIGDMVN